MKDLGDILKSMSPSRMKGKTIMWWITFNVFFMGWISMIFDMRMDGSIAVIYGIAIGAFAGGKITETITERRSSSRTSSHKPAYLEGAE